MMISDDRRIVFRGVVVRIVVFVVNGNFIKMHSLQTAAVEQQIFDVLDFDALDVVDSKMNQSLDQIRRGDVTRN